MLYSYKWLFQNASAISSLDITLPTTIVNFLSINDREGEQMNISEITLKNMKKGALSVERQLLLDGHHFILSV